METLTDFIFLGFKITVDGDCSREIKRRLLPGRKAFTDKPSESQSCLILCNPMDYTVHGILQTIILQRVSLPFSRELPNPGIEPRSPAL